MVFAGFVPIDSGGTARDLHPLPLPEGYVTGHSRREGQNLSSSLLSVCERQFSRCCCREETLTKIANNRRISSEISSGMGFAVPDITLELVKNPFLSRLP